MATYELVGNLSGTVHGTLTNFTIDNFNGVEYSQGYDEVDKYRGIQFDISSLLGGRVFIKTVTILLKVYTSFPVGITYELNVGLAYNCNTTSNYNGTIRSNTTYSLEYDTSGTKYVTKTVNVYGLIWSGESSDLVLYIKGGGTTTTYTFESVLIDYIPQSEMNDKMIVRSISQIGGTTTPVYYYYGYDTNSKKYCVDYITELKTYVVNGNTYAANRATYIYSSIGDTNFITHDPYITYTPGYYYSSTYKFYIHHFGLFVATAVGVRYDDNVLSTYHTDATKLDGINSKFDLAEDYISYDYNIIQAKNPVNLSEIGLNSDGYVYAKTGYLQSDANYRTGHSVEIVVMFIKYKYDDVGGTIVGTDIVYTVDDAIATSSLQLGLDEICLASSVAVYKVNTVPKFMSVMDGNILMVQPNITEPIPSSIKYMVDDTEMTEYLNGRLVVDGDHLDIKITPPGIALAYKITAGDVFVNVPKSSTTEVTLKNVKSGKVLYNTDDIKIYSEFTISQTITSSNTYFYNEFKIALETQYGLTLDIGYNNRQYTHSLTINNNYVTDTKDLIFLPGWQGKIDSEINPNKIAGIVYNSIKKVAGVGDRNLNSDGEEPT